MRNYLKISKRPATLTVYLLLGSLLVLLSFPNLEPNYSTGVDGPLPWVFNHFFHSHINAGKDIVFPHGPLAFLLYPLPTGNNLVLALCIYIFLMLLFACALFHLYTLRGSKGLVAPFFILLVLFHLLDLQLLLIGAAGAMYLLALRTQKDAWFVPAILLTLFALFIKSYAGIICLLLTLSYIVLHLLQRRQKRKSLTLLLLLPLGLLLIWLLLYGTPAGFLRFLWGQVQLAADNSAAVAYYPPNNWWLLGAFIVSVGLVPVLHRKKETLVFYCLFALAAFAAWKHGMAREEVYHTRNFFLFMMLFYVLLVSYAKELSFYSAVAATGGLICFYINLKNVVPYEELTVHAIRTNTFLDMALNLEAYSNYHQTKSEKAISGKKLDSNILATIKDKQLDVYPWDYSYIPANRLNWVARPVLHSYASYTHWLDLQNSRHFESANAPEYLLWDLDKNIADPNTGQLAGIDNRYLLNDEPQTIVTLFSRYRLVQQTNRVLLFQKQQTPQLQNRKQISQSSIRWNEWTDVPPVTDGILRARLQIQKNLLGKVKSWLYKDEAVYVYYQLDDFSVIRQRIVPKNAADGLWINPMILQPQTNRREPLVTKMRLVCSNTKLMQDRIEVQWEVINIAAPFNAIDTTAPAATSFRQAFALFQKYEPAVNPVIQEYMHPFTGANTTDLWKTTSNSFSKTDVYSAPFSNEVAPGGFSSTFSYPLNQLADTTLKAVRVGTWIKCSSSTKARIVVTIERGGETLLWEGRPLKDFIVDASNWNYATVTIPIEQQWLAGSRLQVFIWNEDQGKLFADDLKIQLLHQLP